jgi:signal transduction histidine kinase
MRRWLAIAVALLLALALAACGDDDDSGEAGGGTETSAPAADLGLKEAGTLLVGSDIPYPPFEFTEPGSDEVIGFDVDLVNAIAERLGIAQVRFVKQPFDTLFVMRRIEAEAARMGVLVDDLLLLARLDQGRPMDRERLDLAALVADLVADARAVEPDRPIELVTRGPLEVEGDDMRLRQVVGSLLSNARAHTPAGTPVTVRALASGGEAVVEVADSGPGLAPEHAARIFERFYRADPSRARASGGSGLGLSIVAALAEAHGGRASVETALGRGATLRVCLPLAGALADGAAPDPDG